MLKVFDRQGLQFLPHSFALLLTILVSTGHRGQFLFWYVILFLGLDGIFSSIVDKIPSRDLHVTYPAGALKSIYYSFLFLLDLLIAITLYLLIILPTVRLNTSLLVLASLWLICAGMFVYLFRKTA